MNRPGAPSRQTWRLVLIVAATLIAFWYGQHQGYQAISAQNHDALCALHDDVQRRRDDTVRYLKMHPLGVVSPVTHAVIITAAQLQQGIANQTSTLNALDDAGLEC